MSRGLQQGFDKDQCKNLIDVNPDVSGLGVIVAMLVQSLLAVIIAIVLSFRKHQHFRDTDEPLEKALLKVIDISLLTSIAQMVATLVVIDTLTTDQLYLISNAQLMITIQIVGCTTIVIKYLTSIHIFLYTTLSAMLFAAGVKVKMSESQMLQGQCLQAYWPVSNANRAAFRPDLHFCITAAYWPAAASWHWLLGLYDKRINTQEQCHDPENHRTRNPKFVLRWFHRVVAYIRSCYISFTVAGWVTFVIVTIMIYTASSHMKRNASDRELRSFGQILALSTIGTSVWEIQRSLVEWRQLRRKERIKADLQVERRWTM
ncbi:hypothetical protein BDD12DRAFT_912619 [Trichophaea hybrida]|nr:hypothetical protein BDD12DRAFT_912619 [Trichophaea hybrida]